uniref:Uncharacterized protein n=1 Tax=Arundo donax TaxID=35708 RepID=A0A0A9CZR0_ARUDO
MKSCFHQPNQYPSEDRETASEGNLWLSMFARKGIFSSSSHSQHDLFQPLSIPHMHEQVQDDHCNPDMKIAT